MKLVRLKCFVGVHYKEIFELFHQLFEIVFVIWSFKLQVVIDLTGIWPQNGKKNGYLVMKMLEDFFVGDEAFNI